MVLMLVFMNRTWISVPCEHRDLSSHSSARLQVLVMWIQTYAEHWAGARAEGILRGAYHYLLAGQDANKQAVLFSATVGTDKGELPPILDLEDEYNEDVSNRKTISTCKEFLDIIKQAFGRTPMVYSRTTYLEPRVTIRGKAPVWAKNYELWVAQYPWEFKSASMPNVNMPKQPRGWKDWKFWQ